jgi:hypothetical protein
MKCTACGGHSGGECIECDGTGKIRITGCPYEYVGPDVMELLIAATSMKEGTPPVAGGMMDQTNWFISAAHAVRCNRNHWRAKSMES